MHRVLQESQDSKALGAQWDLVDMRAYLARRASGEQKDHKAQLEPEGSV